MKFGSLIKGLTLAGAVAFASSAMADGFARGSVKGAAPAPFSWTGGYIGLNAGWARTDSDGSNSVPCSTACPYYLTANAAAINNNGGFSLSDDGFTGGAQIGYNLQTGSLVYGIEGDINSLRTKSAVTNDIRYATAPANGNFFANTVETSWLATIRGRLGIASGSTLLYITGGVAFTDAKLSSSVSEHSASVPVCATIGHCGSSSTDAKVGWTIGAGAEFALNRNWTFKGEYLYADFGSMTSSTTASILGAGPLQPINHSADLTLHVVRAGINYKF